jgi:glycosyltransferase involved in cell wall biosynthesis
VTSAEPLRVVVHDYLGHPHQAGLSRQLASRGHHVTHIYCDSLAMGRGNLSRHDDDPTGLSFVGVPLRPLPGIEAAERLSRELRYARDVVRICHRSRADVVLSGNTPPLVQAVLTIFVRAAFIYWLQDLVNAAQAHKVGATPFLSGAGRTWVRLCQFLERFALRRSSAVVTISQLFRPFLDRLGKRAESVHTIENWGPEELLAGQPGTWSQVDKVREHADPILLYAGTLDGRHGLELLDTLGRQCADNGRGVVVVVSEGPSAELLRSRWQGDSARHLRVLDFQPFSEVPAMMNAADLLLVSLSPDAAGMSVPSKVLSYLCAGRPVLAAVPPRSPVADLLERSGAGVVAPPDDPERFASLADELLADPDRRSRMATAGRAYAEQHFDIRTVTDQFETVLHSVTNRTVLLQEKKGIKK